MAVQRLPSRLSGRLGQQVSHSYQVIGCCRESEHPSDSIRPPESRFPLQGDRLHPTEDLLNTLAFPLTHRVALVPSRSPVNRAPPVGRVLRNMRSNLQAAQLLDECLRVVTTVASGNFTWPISAATVAQAKLLVYRQRAVRPENRLKTAGNASSIGFPSQFLRFNAFDDLFTTASEVGQLNRRSGPNMGAEITRRTSRN